MFLERLLNSGSTPLLEQVVHFTAQRHRLLAENIANIDTPGYRQKDLSLRDFHAALRQQIDRRRHGPDSVPNLRDLPLQYPARGILFHDRNNRSMEQLASDLAKNAITHNVAVELLRKQFLGIEAALRERVV